MFGAALDRIVGGFTMACAAVFVPGCDNEPEGLEEANGVVMATDGDDQAVTDIAPGPGEGDPGGTVVGVETLDVTIPASLHALGLAVPAKLVRPVWSAPVGKQPAMMVLHGSGGLLKMPKTKADHPCSSEMESQFRDWSDRLAKLGYTVLLPSSYSARGFCDKHVDTGRIPATFDNKTEQILGRLYDVDAATRFLCDRSEVDCERMGLLGFSQGGTMVMLALHWQIEHAIAFFRSTKADQVDIPIPDVKPGRPEFQLGVAYYPGCGFDGVVPLSTSSKAAIENKFSATSSLTILHGSEDSLLTQCSTEFGTGARQTQAAQVGAQLKIANTYDITVYPGAKHSFDSASSQGADAVAREAALAVTLAKLKEL